MIGQIGVRTRSDQAVVRVRDSGIGITSDWVREVTLWFVGPRKAEMTDVTDGVTSIEVAPDEIPFSWLNVASTTLRGRPAARHPTGARVTVEFARSASICVNTCVRVHYDIAENDEVREIVGIPRLTHTTVRQDCRGLWYHYRLSHWIAAPLVMRFIRRY